METRTLCPCGSPNIDVDLVKQLIICLSCGCRSGIDSYWMLNPVYAEFGIEYRCYRDDKFVGIATFTDDENIGPSFIKMAISSSGELVHEVIIPEMIKLNNHAPGR